MQIKFVNHNRGYMIVSDGEKDVFCLFGGYRQRYQRADGTWAEVTCPVPSTIVRSYTVRMSGVYYDDFHRKWTAKTWSIAEEDRVYRITTAVVKITIEIDGSRGDKLEDVVFVGSRQEAATVSSTLNLRHGVDEPDRQISYEVRDLDLASAIDVEKEGGQNAEPR